MKKRLDLVLGRRRLLAVLMLGASMVSTVACVNRSIKSNPCGEEQEPTCGNDCVAIRCPLLEDCTGLPNAYYCTSVSYTAECQVYAGYKTEGEDNYGMYYCLCGGYEPDGTVEGSSCMRVTAEILDCHQ